ncbi:MAG: hypothetical protein LIO40_05585 [Ruminococcus sp.]|nr:hypothetical protein [Ruminococcus sp.]
MLKVATSFVKSLTAALAELTVWAQTAYNAVADFFGWEQIESSSASAVSDTADAISSAVEEQEALTDAASETAKAEENALAAFDNINKLSDSSSDSGTDSSSGSGGTTSSATVPVTLDTESAVENAKEAAKDISEILGGALVPLLDAWSDYGKPLTDSMKYAFSSIGSMLSAIGSSFAEVWKNGTGYTICSEILQILTNIFNTIGNIAQSFATAWSGGAGTAIVQGFADLFIVMLDVIERCTGATAEWAASLDFSPVLESIAGLLASIRPLSQQIGDALVWVYEDVLLPLAGWVIEDAAPAAINVFSGAIDVLVAIIEALRPLGEWLWDNFLAPIAKWTGGVIVTVLQSLASALGKISDWIKNHEGAVRSIAAAVATLGTSFTIAGKVTEAASALKAAGGVMGILSTAVSGVSTAFSMLNSPIVLVAAAIAAIIAVGALLITHWDEVKEFAAKVWEKVCDIFSSVGDFFKGIWDSICQAFSAVGDWFTDTFNAAVEGIRNVFSSVGDFFKGIWDSICQAFSAVGNWFANIFNTAVEGIRNVFYLICNYFSNSFESIKSFFSGVGSFFKGIWNSITSAFSNVTDWFKDKFSAAWTAVKNVFSAGGRIFEGIKEGITGVFDKVVNTLIDGINTVIAVPFDAVNSAINWVRNLEIAGWEPFSSLSEISVPQIPHLAEGTVVPANYGDFLAVLGDNKREAEVVSPISAIEQAVRNVIGSGQSDINLNVNLDGKSIYKTVIKRNNEAVRMTGKNPLVTA